MVIAPHTSLSPLPCGSGSGFGSNSEASPKPDWSNSYFPPPPNRLQDLELTREASLGRKIEGAALAEELVLSWLRVQAQYTLGSQLNLAELNRATRILYRLTAIQKTLMGLHAEICGKKDNNTPPDNTPDDPELARELADDNDDPDDDPPAPPQSPSPSQSIVPAPTSDMAPSTPDHSQNTQSEISNLESEIPNPQSAICNPQSDIPHSVPRSASVHACPTIPGLDEDYLDQTLAMVARLTGKPVHVVTASSDSASEPPASKSPSPSPSQSEFEQSPSPSPSPSQFSDNPQSAIRNPQSPSVHPVHPVHNVHLTQSVHPTPSAQPTHSHSPPRFQF